MKIVSREGNTLGILSALAGAISLLLKIGSGWVQAYKSALEVNSGHPEADILSILAPAPSYVFAFLAIGIALFAINSGQKSRVWAAIGMSAGVVLLALSIAEYSSELIYKSTLEVTYRL